MNNNIDGRSPFGMSRKYRRALFAAIRSGNGTQQEIERAKSLGKEAFVWMEFRGVIQGMINRSLKKVKR